MDLDKYKLDASDKQLEGLLQDALEPEAVPSGLADKIIVNTQASLSQKRQGFVEWVSQGRNLRVAAVIVLSCVVAMWVMFATNHRDNDVTDLGVVQNEIHTLLAEESLALEWDQAIAVLSLQIDQYQLNGDWQKSLVWVDDVLSETDEQIMGWDGSVSF